ncbi:MAG: agmatinase [Thermodesulfobacteriota bacterium]
MTTAPAFLASELPPTSPEDARLHVLPAPYEATVSYGGGTAAGPEAILRASQQLEVFDGYSQPADLGIYTHPAVDCAGDAETVLGRIEAAVSSILDLSGVPALLGGEHTVTLGALRALKARFGTFGVIQFDAHADLRDTYSDTPYSHACVMRRACELGLPLFQIGVRAISPEELAFRAATPSIAHLDATRLWEQGVPSPLLPPDFPSNIYVTFDVDGLDSALMPATGTPEPGGLTWREAIRAIHLATAGRRVLGLDVVELAPEPGLRHAEYTAARLTYMLMGAAQRSTK